MDQAHRAYMDQEIVVAVSGYAVWLLPESRYIYEVMKWRWMWCICRFKKWPRICKKAGIGPHYWQGSAVNSCMQ